MSMTVFLYFSSYKDVDSDVKFLLNDKSINNIYVNGNVTRVIEGNTSDISFIILPTKNVDFNSYLLLAKELKENGYDVYIAGYLMNRYYNEDPMNYVLNLNKENEVYYVISHGDIDNGALDYMNNHKELFKGLIMLDGHDIKNDNLETLYLCSDDFDIDIKDNNHIRIKGASFDGFSNYENKQLNNLEASKQRQITVDLILEFINGDDYEK